MNGRLKAALVRAIKTAAQTAVALIGTNAIGITGADCSRCFRWQLRHLCLPLLQAFQRYARESPLEGKGEWLIFLAVLRMFGRQRRGF